MTSNDPYEAWRKRRAEVDVEPGFTDRVIDSLRTPAERAALSEPAPRGAVRVAWGYVGAAALLAASLLFGLLRIESVVAFVFFLSSEGF